MRLLAVRFGVAAPAAWESTPRRAGNGADKLLNCAHNT